MAKITITIEDTETGAAVGWSTDNGQYLHEGGTQAEQVALYTLALLAKAGGIELPLVSVPDEDN